LAALGQPHGQDDRSGLSRACNEDRGGLKGGHLVEATLPWSSSHRVSDRHNCWCLCLAALLLTSWWKVLGGASNPCSTLSLSARPRILFRADVTSYGTLLLDNKGSIKGVVWQLPLVLPCRGVSCKDDSRLAWNLHPRSRLGTSKDHWTTCSCQEQGTESTYRLNDKWE